MGGNLTIWYECYNYLSAHHGTERFFFFSQWLARSEIEVLEVARNLLEKSGTVNSLN
jgi:hypothetical protein